MLIKRFFQDKNIFDFLLLFFFLTYPFSINLNSITIIILTFYSVIKYILFREFNLKREGYILIIYFSLLSISALFSDNLKQVESTLSLITFPVLFAINYRAISVKKVFLFYNASVFLSITAALVFNFNYLISNEVPISLFLDWRYNNDHLSQQINFNANYMSLFVAIGFFIIFNQLKMDSKNIIYVISYILIMIYYLFFMFLLSSRLVLCCTFLLILLNIGYIGIKNYKKALAMTVFFLVLTTFLFQVDVFKQRIDRTFNELMSSTEEVKVGGVSVRRNIWECSFDLIKKNKVFGVGFGNEKSELLKCYKTKEGFKEGLIYGYDAHNQYLQSFLSTGFLGFLIVIVIFFIPLIISIRKRNVLFVNISTLFVFFGITESMLEVHKGVILFTFFHLLIVCKSLMHDDSDITYLTSKGSIKT